MWKHKTNIILLIGIFISSAFKWLGWLMILLSLPDLGRKINAFSETIGPSYYPYIYIGFFLFLILVVNWSYVPSFFKRQPAKIDEGSKAEDKNRNILPKQPIVQTPKEPEPLAIPLKVERDVWLLDAVFYVAEGRWESPNMLANNVADIEDPKFLENVVPAHREILQKAYDRDLVIWGKRADQNSGPYVEIDSNYWENHELEFWNIAKGNYEELETSPIGIAPGPIYKELKASKKKVEELWPKQEQVELPEVTPDFNAIQLRELAKNRGWDFSESHIKSPLANFIHAIKQSGHDGDLKIYGRLKRHKLDELTQDEVLKEIPKEHWEEYEVDRHSLIESTENISIVTYIIETGKKGYADLHFNQSQCKQWLETKAENIKNRNLIYQR